MKNEIVISGLLVFSDTRYELLCPRDSGVIDRIVLRTDECISDLEGNNVTVHGKLISKRKKTLVIDADFIHATEDIGVNHTELSGRICQRSDIRKLRNGKEVVTVILAVGEGNYIPCLLWNSHARNKKFRIGEPISLYGRLQSRSFIKRVLDTQYEKMTYEVSVMEIL